MLQYTVQLPPLSLSNSKHSKSKHLQQQPRDVSDDPSIRTHASSIPSSLINNSKRGLPTDKLPTRPPYAALPHPHPVPLSVSTTFSSSSSTRSNSSASPVPSITSPSFFSRPIPRSPLVTSSRPLPSPVPRPSPHPLKTPLPSVEEYGSIASNYGESTLRTATSRSSRRSSVSSSTAVDVLSKGDLIGEGLTLQGEVIRRVDIPSASPRVEDPAGELEVVGRLGTGSYATVYHVREVLYRPPASDDGHCGVAAAGRLELEEASFSGFGGRASVEYGKEYAVKLLSRANLDEDGLDTQQLEATIHQSLRPHPNIVTLHRTFETPSYLLLLLEFVPGEDLFYFLEQARDHYDSDPALSTSPNDSSSASEESFSSSASSRTPPTPSLLSSLNPNKLLSKTRLRLIASMFSQMCDAVASCHDQRVFHRDIKPENFIVTDGWSSGLGDERVRKVVVKLTDFGLSTVDVESGDMDVGSAPYMSYECRNNVHPTYSPRAADVWSLGIVLINMLYHYNPWTDTTEGACSAFELYRQQPVQFFMSRFTGMTLPVAEFLANKVFCILRVPNDDSQRISARQFGIWIKDLPALLGQSSSSVANGGHSRNVSISSTMGYRIASIPHSRRPSLRPSSTRPGSSAGMATEILGLGIGLGGISQRASRALSRAPSLGPQFETAEEMGDLSTIDQEADEPEAENVETDSRSASTNKRRKRGRKGKGAQQVNATTSNDSTSIVDKTLNTLAEASQALARELSRTSRSVPTSSQTSVTTPAASIHHSAVTNPNSIYSHLEQQTPSNVALQSPLVQVPSSSSLTSSLKAGVTSSTVSAPSPLSSSVTHIPPPITANPPPPVITKKPSKWRLGFGKGSHGQSDRSSVSSKSSALQSQPSAIEEARPHTPLGSVSNKPMSTTASNVTNLLMGLNAPAQSSKNASPPHRAFDGHAQHHNQNAPYIPPSSSVTSLEEQPSIWQRGRRPKVIGGGHSLGAGSSTWGPSGASSAFGVTGANHGPYGHHSNHSNTSWGPPSNGSHTNLSSNPNFAVNNASNQSFHNNDRRSDRAVSPTSMRSGRQPVAGPSSSSPSGHGNCEVPAGSSAASSGSKTNNDWRASMSSLGGVSTMSGSSAFTRLSNGSQRSVSTAATSVSSASSWRSNGSKYPYNYETTGQLPPNVKLVTGTPWELDQLPRQMYANPEDVRFGSPPVRKRRAKQKDPKLDTINEWSGQKPSPLAQRQDAMTSTTGLDGEGGTADPVEGTSPRKVQKGQINALAKMLSALRR